MFGFLPVNKLRGQASSHVVAQTKRLIESAKVGHAGTLDPLATGILVLCIGPATRLARFIQEKSKSYVGEFRLGFTSRSDDIECQLEPVSNAPCISRQQLVDVLPDFCGEISQKPPLFSAVKIGGQRAYRLARKGRQVQLRERKVDVHSIELLEFDYPDFQLRIVCGSGTYVRALGRDIGLKLESGAVMTGLIRTAIGQYKLEDALPSDQLSKAEIINHLLPPVAAFDHLPKVSLSASSIRELANGAILPAEGIDCDPFATTIVAVDERVNLVAVLTRHAGDRFKPTINFAHLFC